MMLHKMTMWVENSELVPRFDVGDRDIENPFGNWLNVEKFDVNHIPASDRSTYIGWRCDLKNLYNNQQHPIYSWDALITDLLDHMHYNVNDYGFQYFLRDLAEFFNGIIHISNSEDSSDEYLITFEQGNASINEIERQWGEKYDFDDYFELEELPEKEKIRRNI